MIFRLEKVDSRVTRSSSNRRTVDETVKTCEPQFQCPEPFEEYVNFKKMTLETVSYVPFEVYQHW